jgi:hypothetical protein
MAKPSRQPDYSCILDPGVLLLASISADTVALLGNMPAWAQLGAWLINAAVGLGIWNATRAVLNRGPAASPKQGSWRAKMDAAIVLMTMAFAVTRWRVGPSVVSSFDGVYPVLVAMTAVAFAYRRWRNRLM